MTSNESSLIGLTEEQRNTAEHFRDLIGGMDFPAAVEILINHSWNLEEAVNEFMGLGDQSNSRQRQVLTNTRDHLPPTIDLSPASYTDSVIPTASSYSNWLSWGLRLLFSPLTITFGAISAISGFLLSLIWPDPRTIVKDPVGDVRKFSEMFSKKYTSDFNLPFFQGSYAEAFKDARSSLRYLVVYLHADSQKDIDKFCKNTLCHSRVVQYLNDASELIFWACNTSSPEGFRVSSSLRASKFPFFGVIGLSNSHTTDFAPANRMALLGRVEAALTPEDLVARLKEIISRSSSAIQAARFERSEIQAAQRLRREQDQAYEQSLVLDRAKKMKKQKEEEAAREAEMREQVVKTRKLRLEKAFEKRITFWDHNLPEEPQQNGGNVVKLSVKMPNGVRFTRLFNINHSVKALYYFVRSRPDCPRNFKLQSNFPKRLIECVPEDESDLEVYLSEDEDNGDRKSKNLASVVDSQFWLPGQCDPPSFADMDLTKPEVIFVLDEDA